MQGQEEKIQNLIFSIKNISDLRDWEQKIRDYIIQEVDEGHKFINLIELICQEKQTDFRDQRVFFLKKRIIVLMSEIFQHQIIEYIPLITEQFQYCISLANKEDYQNIIGDIFKDLIDNATKKAEFQDYDNYLDKFFVKIFEMCEDDNKQIQKTVQIILQKVIKKIPKIYQEKKFYFLNKNFIRVMNQKNNKYLNYSINAYKILFSNVQIKSQTQYEIVHNLCVDLLKNKEIKIKISTLYLLITLNQIFEKESLKYKKKIIPLLVKLQSSQSKKIRELVQRLQERLTKKSKSVQRQPLFNRTTPSPIRRESIHIYDNPKNYDHIGPAIKKQQLNKKFLKNSQTEKNQIFFKERQNRERFKSFQNNSIDIKQVQNIQNHESFNNFQNVTKSNKALADNQRKKENLQQIFELNENQETLKQEINFDISQNKVQNNDKAEKQKVEQNDQNQNNQQEYVQGSDIIFKKSLEPLNFYDADSKFFFKTTDSKSSHKSHNERSCCHNCKQQEEKVNQLELKTLDQQKEIEEIISAVTILKQQNDYLQTKVKYFEQMITYFESDFKLKQDKRLFQSFGKMFDRESTQTIENITKRSQLKSLNTKESHLYQDKIQTKNQQLQKIFQIKTSEDQVKELIKFLKEESNIQNLNEIETNLKHKLLKTLILILNMSSKINAEDENITLKWIKLFVSQKEPKHKEELMSLYSGLILLKNTAKSDNLRQQTIEILQDEYIQKAQIYFASEISKNLPSTDSIPRLTEKQKQLNILIQFINHIDLFQFFFILLQLIKNEHQSKKIRRNKINLQRNN